MNATVRACLATLASLLLVAPALAVPSGFTYTGELWAENGLPYQGAVDVQVALYGAGEGGAALWTGDLGEIWVSGGVLSVDVDDAGLPALLSGHESLWLEFTIDAETLAPRQRLSSVPYAHVAGDAATLGGMPASAFVPASEAINASQLPTDGIGTISNGALSNAFQDVSWSWSGGVNIIDFPAPASQTTLTTSETGDSYLTGITVFTKFTLNTISRVTMTLTPPPGSGVGPIVLIDDQQMPFDTYSNAWTPGNAPGLGGLLGQKVEGTWTLAVQDNDLNSPAGTVVGQIQEFNVTYDVVRSDHMQVGGRLDVSGDLEVGGMVLAKGGVARKMHRVQFKSAHGELSPGQDLPDRTISFSKHLDDTSIRVEWQDALRVYAATTGATSGRIEVLINGESCSDPHPLHLDIYVHPGNVNHHRPQTNTYYCSGVGGGALPAGPYTISARYVSALSGTTAQLYIGWSNSSGSLAVEEVY